MNNINDNNIDVEERLKQLQEEIDSEKLAIRDTDNANSFNKESFGLVLAGGGAKGAYQIGALIALGELGMLSGIKAISGTSIGGINLAMFAGSTLEKAENAWRNFNGNDFLLFDDNGFDITKYGDGIFTRESLLKILRDNVDYSAVSSKEYPLYVTVCYRNELMEDKVRYVKINGLSSDEIENYLMATSAIPVVYDSINIDGVLYFDGGLLDNTPVAPLYGEGIKNFIVISNDNNYLTAKGDFPGTNIIDIVPSASLDMDTVLGTVDLDSSHAIYRLRLGYYDAKAIVSAAIEGRTIPDLSGNSTLAKGEMKLEQMNNQAGTSIGNLSNMLGKYGIKI